MWRIGTSASLAMVYIGLDDKDDAFALLDKAYDEHSFSLAFVKVHPAFDPLRSDRRFGDLMHRIRLSPSRVVHSGGIVTTSL